MFDDDSFEFLFGYHRPGYCFDDDYDHRWSYRSEKSGAAEKREEMVTQRFNAVKKQVESTLLEKTMVTIKLGCHPKSQSLLKSLPGILIEDICKFAGLPKAGPSSSNVSSVAASASISSSPATKKKKGKKADAGEKAIGIDLKDFSIYHPGGKIVIPLTTPNEHLTGPCWRDFGRAVRRNARWEAKRVAATPSEKAQYKETRKGKVYFINVIYTVPGKPLPKQAKKAPEKPAGKRKIDDTVNYTFPVKPSSTQVKNATELTAGKKAIDNINNYTAPVKPSPKIAKKAPELLAGKRAINNYTAPAESSLKQAEKAPYKPTGKKAIDHVLKTYYAAVNSGVNSITGEVDGKILKEAMDAGHSRQTILARVAKLRGDGDQKPSAKKKKQG